MKKVIFEDSHVLILETHDDLFFYMVENKEVINNKISQVFHNTDNKVDESIKKYWDFFSETNNTIGVCTKFDNLHIRKIMKFKEIIEAGRIVRINSNDSWNWSDNYKNALIVDECTKDEAKNFLSFGKFTYQGFKITQETIILENDSKVDSDFENKILSQFSDVDVLTNFKTELKLNPNIVEQIVDKCNTIAFTTTVTDINQIEYLVNTITNLVECKEKYINVVANISEEHIHLIGDKSKYIKLTLVEL